MGQGGCLTGFPGARRLSHGHRRSWPLPQHGLGEEAVGLFEDMLRRVGVKPDRITYVGVFSASGFVEEGKRYYEQMQTEHDVVPEMSHYACMVDLLACAGRSSGIHPSDAY
jgi:pentatricopeptide repeat protein